jgi:formylglycine-generating enzyme required for sulfatase activity/tetratricopeptide (TPR) repeat protein
VARSGDLATTKYIPVDVAGYVATDPQGQPVDRYTALWVEPAGPDDEARLYVGTTVDDHQAVQDRLKEAKLIARTITAVRGTDGRLRSCGVWGKLPGAAVASGWRWQSDRDLFEGSFEQDLANRGDQLLLDVAVSAASPPRTIQERARSALERADRRLKANADDLEARRARARTNLRLGETARALDDFNALLGKNKDDVDALQYRAIALARLGRKPEAQSELENFQNGVAAERSKLFLAAVVAAELGEGTEKAIAALDAAVGKAFKDAELRYEAACAFALASKAIARRDQARGRQLAGRSLRLLQESAQNDEAELGQMDEDPDLDPIRDDLAFTAMMKAGHPDRRYAAVWSSDARFEATPSYGLDPGAHLRRCRDLVAQGYRPVSWSVGRTAPEGPLITASVWHRPVIPEGTKDRLAERQARAAVALIRLGHADEVWPLLRHSADPQLRSFIVNWLSPLGADPKVVAAELVRLDSSPRPVEWGEGGRRPGEGSAMDAILFHPETSTRRALILALGTYPADGLSPGEREPLAARLLEVYRDDPDAGIHGAAEWTLRQWGQQEKLRTLDAGLTQLKDRGQRRWYVNGQGQTLVLIEGPVEFLMGSPPNEPDRFSSETLHRRVISRRFAIAAKEVTVAQYQEFVKENPAVDHATNDRYSPDPNGPMNGVTWFQAAAYCNWLSRKEKLPEYYQQNEQGQYNAGMRIKAEAWKSAGYRLPTEAEWEYACRTGARTSRYYGASEHLIGFYAWHLANSQDRAWPGGRLKPNDLGLFDILGNMFEWCQDRAQTDQPGKRISIDFDLIDINIHRVVRGGAYDNRPAHVRAAFRPLVVPWLRGAANGFRLARTYR